MLMMLIAMAAQATAPETTPAPRESLGQRAGEVVHKGGELASKPAYDVGIAKTKIPPALEKAAMGPYSLHGTGNCSQIAAGLRALNAALGPDFGTGSNGKTDSTVQRIAEAGGQSLVNGLVPFRGLVREVSGAAPAERRLAAAVTAGNARRGFLRGLSVGRKCQKN